MQLVTLCKALVWGGICACSHFSGETIHGFHEIFKPIREPPFAVPSQSDDWSFELLSPLFSFFCPLLKISFPIVITRGSQVIFSPPAQSFLVRKLSPFQDQLKEWQWKQKRKNF